MKIPTTYDVWRTIRKAHPELMVFSSFSAPDGNYYGNPDQGEMITTYGFRASDFDLIGARTTWDVDRDNPANRLNEKHEYWLCVHVQD